MSSLVLEKKEEKERKKKKEMRLGGGRGLSLDDETSSTVSVLSVGWLVRKVK